MRYIGKGVTVVLAVLIIAVLIPVITAVSAPPSDNVLEVVFIDGQSNGAYSNVAGSVDISLVNSELSEPATNLFYFGTSVPTSGYASVNDCAIHPMYVDGEYTIGGLDAPLAYYLSEKTEKDVLVINISISAQSITNLVPGSTGGDWGISVVDKALSMITGYDSIKMVGWFWLQGESDKNMSVSTYENYFLKLDRYFNSIKAYDCYIIPVRESVGGNAHIAQINLINSYRTIHDATEIQNDFTLENGLLLDNLHYSQEARILLMEASVNSMNFNEVNPYNYVILGIIPILIIAIPIVLIARFIGGDLE